MSQPVDDLKCSVVVDRIEEWMDGDLCTEEAAAVEAHLSGCRSCAEELRLARSVQQGLHELPVYELPQEVIEAVAAATRPGLWVRLRQAFKGALLRPLPVLAATAAVALVVVLARPLEEPTRPAYSDLEIQQAVDDTRLALGYVGWAAKRAQLQARNRVFQGQAVSTTVRGISQSLKWVGGSSAVTPGEFHSEGPEGSSS